MTVTTNLSVAELNYKSDRVGMRQESCIVGNGSYTEHSLQIEVTGRQTLVVRSYKECRYSTQDYQNSKGLIKQITESVIEFDECDIDSMILFLQDAKQFIEEDKVYRSLRGERD